MDGDSSDAAGDEHPVPFGAGFGLPSGCASSTRNSVDRTHTPSNNVGRVFAFSTTDTHWTNHTGGSYNSSRMVLATAGTSHSRSVRSNSYASSSSSTSSAQHQHTIHSSTPHTVPKDDATQHTTRFTIDGGTNTPTYIHTPATAAAAPSTG